MPLLAVLPGVLLIRVNGDSEDVGPPRLTYGQIFFRFLRFGLLAWGGPVAQIGMLRRELVDEERWISSARFNRVLAVYQVLPGPEAHEICVYMGMLARGKLGGFLAGLGFMLPGLVLMLALSWLYFVVDLTTASLGAAFLGVQVAVVALIVRAVHRIGGHALVNPWLWGLALGCGVGSLLGVSYWITLAIAGGVHALASRSRTTPALVMLAAAVVAIAVAVVGGTPGAPSFGAAAADLGALSPAPNPTTLGIFWSGLRAGLLTFGGAYTAIPFLRADAVSGGWMTEAQFLDGLALSGILPAPFIIFSTFVGFVVGGAAGALAMTAGIFLPAFGFSLVFDRQVESVIENRSLHALLEGVTAGVVGLIAATTVEIGLATVGRLPSLPVGFLVFASALTTLYLWKARANVVFVVLGAGIAGWLGFDLIR